MTKDEALKLALDELGYWRNKVLRDEADFVADEYDETITAIREALAQQPAQKRPQNCGTGYCSCIECVMEPQQEPVAWMSPGKERLEFSRKDTVYGSHTIPLYTSPPTRKPLTNEEIEQCMKQAYSTAQGRLLERAFARAIEAAHGIKENT